MKARLLGVAILVGGSLTGAANATTYIVTDLGPGVALGLNDNGQVVGYRATGGGPAQAVVWNGTTPTALSALPGASETVATGISIGGQIVGSSYYGSTRASQAVVWNGTTPTALSTPAGTLISQATGINNSGQIVGFVSPTGNPSVATVWNGIIPTTLGTLAGSSGAYGINNSGQVVGVSNNGTNTTASQISAPRYSRDGSGAAWTS
jgi:uncharacterized membrane protein